MPSVLLAHRSSARQGSAQLARLMRALWRWSRSGAACFNGAMPLLILMAAGACLELLLLVLPLAHLAQWSSPAPADLVYGLAGLPIVMVFAAILRPEPRIPGGVVPLSPLPVLIIEPRLTGPQVYAGAAGVGTWTLTVLAALAWVWCALRHHRGAIEIADGEAKSAPLGPWVGAPVVMATLVWSVFLAPLLVAPKSGEMAGAVTAALMGLVVSLWVGFRWVGRELAELEMDPRARRRLRTQALLHRRFSPQVFWSSLAVSLALGIITSVVYGAV